MVNIVINQEIEFLEEKSAWQGVKRVAGYVRNDMEKVFGLSLIHILQKYFVMVKK